MSKHEYTKGSGNVFADLGIAHPEEALAKAELAHKIISLIDARKLTQTEAAELLGIDQPKVSALVRGRLSAFSMERLLRFLMRLDQDIQITVKSRPRGRSRSRLLVA